MPADKQPHNLSTVLLGTGEFSFASGAASLAAAQLVGWQDFDNVTTFSVQSKNEKVEHFGSYRGVKRLDKTYFKRVQAGYQLKFSAIDAQRISVMYYGTVGANYTQVVRSAVAADAIAGGAPVKGRWYDIMIGGVRVRELTVVTSATGVEDTDYVVDYKLGRIRAVTATGFGALTVTAPAILVTSANTFSQIVPMNRPVLNGMGRILVWNNDGSLILDHHDFYCEIFPEGDAAVADDIIELTHTVNILTPVGIVGWAPGAV